MIFFKLLDDFPLNMWRLHQFCGKKIPGRSGSMSPGQWRLRLPGAIFLAWWIHGWWMHWEGEKKMFSKICLLIYGKQSTFCRLVVDLPLWKIWVRQLGWLFPIYGKIKFMFQTASQIIIYYHVQTYSIEIQGTKVSIPRWPKEKGPGTCGFQAGATGPSRPVTKRGECSKKWTNLSMIATNMEEIRKITYTTCWSGDPC